MTSLLPPNSTGLERVLESLIAARTDAVDAPLRKLWSAADCPVELLPWLAWALSIDTWDADWPESVRRARVANAIGIQRRKGTGQSVRDVVNSFGGSVVVREWWQTSPAGTPHTFQLLVTLAGEGDQPPSASYIEAVISEVSRTKPARSHFTFVLAVNMRGQIGLRAIGRPSVYARISGNAAANSIDANALTLGGDLLTLGGDYLTLGA